MNPARIVRNLLPAFLITLGLGAIGVVYATTPAPSKVNLSVHNSTPEPAATPQPPASPQARVTVDGRRVPVGTNGSVSLSLPSGNTKIESSSNHTTVTTTSPAVGDVEEATDDGSMSVSVHSSSNGGNSRSRTNVTSRDNSSTRSSSSTTTTVHGTGQRTVNIEQ